MAAATAQKAPPVLATMTTSAPVVATPAPVTKESALPTQPSMERRTGLPIDDSGIVKPKPSPPVKDVPKSPVNGYANGHANGHAKPSTPRSGGDHPHGPGCGCHKCSGGDLTHHHGAGYIGGYNEITHISDPYCPNPSLPNICKDYETKVRIIQRIPEMRQVEKTFFVQQLVHEDRITRVKKTRVVMEDVEDWVTVPVVKEVPRLQTIKVYKIHEELRTHTYEVPVIEYERRCTTKQIPRVCMEDEEREIKVPLIIEVPEVLKVQIPTGEFCENPVEEYCTPGDFNLLCKGGRHHGDHHKHSSSLSDSESDADEILYSFKHGKDPIPINTKPGQDYEPTKPLSPITTKSVPGTKPSDDPEPKPHDAPYPDPKPHDKPHC